MHMKQSVIVHYHEIGLKGKNRPLFIDRLIRNLEHATNGLGVRRVRKGSGVVIIDLDDSADVQALRQRIESVFGIAKFAFARRQAADLDAIRDAVLPALAEHQFTTFRVTTKRSDKSFPMTSEEINRRLGADIQRHTGAPVSLKTPDLNLHVEILPQGAYWYFEEIKGPGGLPVGVSGRVVALLSGGIDSPVAARRLMKRGCEVVFVHFHSFPYVEGTSREKAIELAKLLTRHQQRTRLYLVPLAEVQRAIVVEAPPDCRVVLYRRFMARIAEAVAHRERAKALVTGESLGQVASQTLDNLAAIGAAVDLPVLRPLIGMDKQEIVDEAIAVGSYPISILPDEDCCSLWVPRHPSTRVTIADAERYEAVLDPPALVRQALAGAEVIDLVFDSLTGQAVPIPPREEKTAHE